MSEQKVTRKPKRIPYGMMNFEHVRRDNCYYDGQTMMYNSNMVLYFIDQYRSGLYLLPKDMLDANIRFDYENDMIQIYFTRN